MPFQQEAPFQEMNLGLNEKEGARWAARSGCHSPSALDCRWDELFQVLDTLDSPQWRVVTWNCKPTEPFLSQVVSVQHQKVKLPGIEALFYVSVLFSRSGVLKPAHWHSVLESHYPRSSSGFAPLSHQVFMLAQHVFFYLAIIADWCALGHLIYREINKQTNKT